jgi:hypothetical protein
MKFPKKYFAILIAVLLVVQVLYDPISSVKHALTISSIRDQLPQAQAKWEKLEITDYTFEIIGDARSICQLSARIEVQDAKVVKVETLGANPQILPPNQWTDPDWGHEVFLCNYNHFTMLQIFEQMEQTLQSFPSSILHADFDAEYGFVTSFEYGIYVGYGLARPQISHCCNFFRIQNFQPNNRQSKLLCGKFINNLTQRRKGAKIKALNLCAFAFKERRIQNLRLAKIPTC